MTVPTEYRPICEWRGCAANGVNLVRAQWSIVDWLDAYVCSAHELEMMRWMHTRTVDGQYPLDVYVVLRAELKS